MCKKTLFVFAIFILSFYGCSNKLQNSDNYNKPASYWYSEIIKNIKSGDLDKADEDYASLSSEHVASPLLKEAMLILSKAHAAKEEKVLSTFYIDNYIKRYAQSQNIEYLKYLKLKSSFQALQKIKRDQKLLLDTIKNAKSYIKTYPTSKYNPLVHTMLTKLYLANLVLDRDIAKLYKKTGKSKSAKIYENKIKSSWLKNTKIDLSNQGMFDKIFN